MAGKKEESKNEKKENCCEEISTRQSSLVLRLLQRGPSIIFTVTIITVITVSFSESSLDTVIVSATLDIRHVPFMLCCLLSVALRPQKP